MTKNIRRIITFDEYMRMSEQERDAFLDEDERLLSEGIGDKNQSNIDFQGMRIEECIEKYGLIELDVFFDNLLKRLGFE